MIILSATRCSPAGYHTNVPIFWLRIFFAKRILVIKTVAEIPNEFLFNFAIIREFRNENPATGLETKVSVSVFMIPGKARRLNVIIEADIFDENNANVIPIERVFATSTQA